MKTMLMTERDYRKEANRIARRSSFSAAGKIYFEPIPEGYIKKGIPFGWRKKTKPDLIVEENSSEEPDQIHTSHGLCEKACYDRWLKKEMEK